MTLTAASVGEIVNALAEGYSVREVAAAYGVSRNSINEIRIGRAWGHLPRPPQLPQPYREARGGEGLYRVRRGDRRRPPPQLAHGHDVQPPALPATPRRATAAGLEAAWTGAKPEAEAPPPTPTYKVR